jgi:hypothetical protein
VVEMLPDQGGVQEAFLKRLVAITPTKVKLEQYNPVRILEIDRRKVLQVVRVMTMQDVLAV